MIYQNRTCAERRVLTRSKGYVTEAAVIPAKPPPARRIHKSALMFVPLLSTPMNICRNCRIEKQRKHYKIKLKCTCDYRISAKNVCTNILVAFKCVETDGGVR